MDTNDFLKWMLDQVRCSPGLAMEFPVMEEITTSSGLGDFTYPTPVRLVVLDPDFSDKTFDLLKYLSLDDNLKDEYNQREAEIQRKYDSLNAVEIKVDSLFEKTDVIVNGETLYRRK